MKIRNLLLALLACASLVCAQEESETESEAASAPAQSSTSTSASASGAHTLGVGYYGMIAGALPGVGVVYAVSPSTALQFAA